MLKSMSSGSVHGILILLCNLWTVHALADSQYVLKSPRGKIEKVATVDREQAKEAIRNLPVSQYNDAATLCGGENLAILETGLELESIIQALNKQEPPRTLSEQQKEFLAEAPFCSGFYAHFTVISKLLDGYQLAPPQSLARK